MQIGLDFNLVEDLVAGVDEVGRGPLCGAVVTAAVILDPARPILGLNDSKKLTEARREALFDEICEKALSFCIARAEVEEIDRLNILHATMLAMQRAVEGLHITLSDGSAGWLVYRNTKVTLRTTLSHLIIHTEQGNPNEVGTQLLVNLHTHYPHHDTYAENIHKEDAHLPAFQALGYFENFSRIEMIRSTNI